MSRPGFRSHLSIEPLMFLNKCSEFGIPLLPGLLIFSVVCWHYSFFNLPTVITLKVFEFIVILTLFSELVM